MFNEQEIIQELQQAFTQTNSEIIGIGDDAAVIPLSNVQSYVITKDLLVENKHFSLKYYDAKSLAHKALHVNLSDLAAMGATPSYATLGLAIPSSLSEDFLRDFLIHFTCSCKESGVHLIGGDTTASGDIFIISLTVVGRIQTAQLKFRHTAQVGDCIVLVGHLGHAHIGLNALEKDIPGLEEFKVAALQPVALIQEGSWLGGRRGVTAMMDLSDGLYVDLSRLCDASKVGAEIQVTNLNPSEDYIQSCSLLQLDPLECLLTGGEDYGLLLTINDDSYKEIADAFERTFGYQLTGIGKITDTGVVRLMKNGNEIPFTYRPFSHFGEL